MLDTTIRVCNIGTQTDPVYEGIEDHTGARMDGERKDGGGRSLSGWYPGIADHMRRVHGLDEDLTFPVSTDGDPAVTTFEGRTAKVTVHDLRDHAVSPTAWPTEEELRELTPGELVEVVRTIVERESYGWTRGDQSRPFLEMVRSLVSQGRSEAVTQACALYFGAVPLAKEGVLSALPGIIVNRHPSFAGINGNHEASRLLMGHPEWADVIKDAVGSPGFRAVVDDLARRVFQPSAA